MEPELCLKCGGYAAGKGPLCTAHSTEWFYTPQAIAEIEKILKDIRATLENDAMNVANESGKSWIDSDDVKAAWKRNFE